MPDLQQFQVIENPGPPVTQTISCLITHSQTGAVLFDFTGASAFSLEAELAALPRAVRLEVLESVIQRIIRRKAGL